MTVRRWAGAIGLSASFLLAGSVLLSSAADAETRVALVIGNSDYAHAPRLTNPANDADAISASLRKANFAVSEYKNLKSDDLRLAIIAFSKKAENADVAVVYYAGHGIQADGENYLIPVDAVLASPGSLSLEAVPADSVLGAVALAHHLRLLILDACRDNPFKAELAAAGTRGVASRGLAPISDSGTNDTIVAYSAKENTVAEDGAGANSPFAASLAKRMDEPGVELDKMFREVRDDVITATNGNQTPFVYGSRGGNDFYFMPGGTIVNNYAAPQTPAPGVDPKMVELSFWNSASGSNDPAQLKAYLDAYPNGTFAELAHAKLASLEKSAPANPMPSSLPQSPGMTLFDHIPLDQPGHGYGVPMTQTPAAPASATADGKGRFDGTWDTIVSCPKFADAISYSFKFEATVKDGALHGVRGTKDRPGYTQIDGKIAPDGTGSFYVNELTGAAIAAVNHVSSGTEFGYSVDAKFADGSGTGHRVEGRPCTLTFNKQ